MKKTVVFILCLLFLTFIILNVKQAEKINRVSTNITQSINGNIHQICGFYESMYTNEEPNQYFESSLLYMNDICDSVKEEISFYYSIYPKRILFLENIIDDYKLIIRMLREREVSDELITMHNQLQHYITSYNNDTAYSRNYADSFYKKDKKIKENDYDYELLHMKIIEASHDKQTD